MATTTSIRYRSTVLALTQAACMATPLLLAKLHRPSPRSHLVRRDRILQTLQQRLGSRLILVSAPAGFGKTTIPGARLKIHANGLVEIDQRDYTTEANYRTDGRLRTLGDVELTYDSSGRLRSIDGTRFSYFSSGRPQSMGDVDFSYFSRGQLQRIEDVSFEYERNGTIKRISADQTRDGLPIVIAH